MAHADRIRLILTGDVMTGRGIDQALSCAGDPQIHESYMQSAQGYLALAEEHSGPIPVPVPFDYIWGEALNIIAAREPDCRLINLETAITRCDDFWLGKGINYRMHPGNIPCLSAAQIDICGLANNHVLDWGYGGLTETLESLQQAGLQIAGAGRNIQAATTPAISQLAQERLLFSACGHPSSGIPEAWGATEKGPGINLVGELSEETARDIAGQLHEYRRSGDIAATSIHWGGNWGYRIGRQQRSFAHHLIDAGVDLVHGHSSHHPQGIEVYRGRAILYGCGDLINDYEGISGHEEYRSHLRLLYCVDLERKSGALRRMELIPFEMLRFRLQRPEDSDRDWLFHKLDRECRHLGTTLRPSEDGETFLLDW